MILTFATAFGSALVASTGTYLYCRRHPPKVLRIAAVKVVNGTPMADRRRRDRRAAARSRR